MDLLFNGLLLILDFAVLVFVARAQRISDGVKALLLGGASALIASFLLQQGAFHFLRLQAWLIFAHIPVVLCGIALIARRKSRLLLVGCLALAAVLWATAAYAFVLEPYRLEVSNVTVRSAKISVPTRIAVVADFQTDQIGDYERRALSQVLASKPDLILMPGDYLQEYSAARQPLEEEFRNLLQQIDFGAPLGAYASRGNTEQDGWPELFRSTRVTPIAETSTLTVGELTITGLGFGDSYDPKLAVAAADRFQIVFGHYPNFALGDVQADLLVAGHTHGGQVQLPFIGPLITLSKVPRSWAAGVTELSGGRTLVVSQGIGMERGKAPRLRFLCRPQIVVIDLLPVTGVQ